MFKYKLVLRLLKIVPKWLRNSSQKRLRALLKFYIKGNQLIIIRPDGTKLINPIHDYKFLRLTASGDCTNNTVIAYENQINGTNLDFNFFNGANNVFELGKNNMIGMAAYIQGYNGHARIGDNNYICGSTLYLYCSGKTEFSIGNGNLFSSGITLWGGEGHSVIDSKTGEITNTGGNIRIGDNNWVCMNVCFLKRAQIENGNVVGYGSIVSKPIDASRCVIAGNPAKVIKTDILWADAAPWAYNGEIYRGAPDNGN